jgi:Tfp pilus assembly protein PilF
MPGWYRVINAVAVVATMTGCASLGPSGGQFRDSSLANFHPAPAAMSPQVTGPDGDPTLDPVYMTSQADYHYTMGEAMSLEGRSEKAVEEFKLTLVYDPNSVLVRLRLATEYVRQGLLTEAIEQAEAAVEKDPDAEEPRFLLAGLYQSLKMYDLALKQYETVINKHPENADAPIYMGAILAEQKKYDEAVAHFQRVAAQPGAKEPERAHYYVGRIRTEQGETRYKEAEQAYMQALKAKPDFSDAALALANLMRDSNRESQGVKLLESFQEKFGPNRDIARHLSNVYLDKEQYAKAFEQLEYLEGFERDNLNVRIRLALILIEQKKFEAAIIRLEDILAQAPDLDKIRYYLGAVYEEIKNSKMALQNYEMIPPSSTYYPDSVIHSALILKTLGQIKVAVDVVKKAIELRDDVPQFYAYYATLLDDQKRFRDAVNMLKGAVGRFPEHAQLHFFLGSMHDRLGEFQSTIDQMKRVLEIDKDHVQAMNYLAYTYAEQEMELDEAESMARRALSMQPEDGYIMDTVGWVLFKKGRTDAAIRYLEAAYRAKADEAIIAEHLGDAYFRSQLLEKARSMYKKASELETDDGKVVKIKDKLAATERQMQTVQRLPANLRK